MIKYYITIDSANEVSWTVSSGDQIFLWFCGGEVYAYSGTLRSDNSFEDHLVDEHFSLDYVCLINPNAANQIRQTYAEFEEIKRIVNSKKA